MAFERFDQEKSTGVLNRTIGVYQILSMKLIMCSVWTWNIVWDPFMNEIVVIFDREGVEFTTYKIIHQTDGLCPILINIVGCFPWTVS